MYIKTKQIEPLGFKGSGMYDSASSFNYYYKKDPLNHRIIGIVNIFPQSVYSYQLTPNEYKQFENNKLGIIPPGCCSASGRKCKENYTLHYEGEFKNMKHVRKILDKIDVYYSFDTL